MDGEPTSDELLLTLRLRLRLTRTRSHAGWTAQLSVPGMSGHLMFPTLRDLIDWIARLDTATLPRAPPS
jgi:hypothetical protein